MTKLVLFANDKVGLDVSQFLIDSYPDDLALVVVLKENEISLACKSARIPWVVYTNERELIQLLEPINFDFGLLAWWPHLISEKLLKKAPAGFINTHNSFLPINRGKHPYFWALVDQTKYGVSLHYVDNSIDGGDVLAQTEIEYSWEDNSDSLYSRSLEAMTDLVKETYPAIRLGLINGVPQESGGNIHYSAQLNVARQVELDQEYTGRQLLNLLRAGSSDSPEFPPCFFLDNGQKYSIKVIISPAD